jgi:hypothetical protein
MNGRSDDVKGAPSELALAYHGSKVCLDGLVLRILHSVFRSAKVGRSRQRVDAPLGRCRIVSAWGLDVRVTGSAGA